MRKHKSAVRRITCPVSVESIRSFERTTVEQRFAWIEEMIHFRAGLPGRVRELHAKYRELARR